MLVLTGVGLTISHFFGRFWDLVVTAAVMLLLGPACGAGDADTAVLQGVLEVTLALRVSLFCIVSTTGRGVADSAA